MGKPNAVCRAVNGEVTCVENEVPPPDGTYFLPEITRDEFHHVYRCPKLAWEEQEQKLETFLRWPEHGSFFQASNVNATLADGTRYTFIDDRGKHEVISYSLSRDEISRKEYWIENGTSRRLALEFDTIEPDDTSLGGWKLNHMRMYSDLLEGDCQEYVWWRGTGSRKFHQDSDTMHHQNNIIVPFPGKIFSCDYMEFTLLSETFYDGKIGGTFSASNVFMGAMMGDDDEVCTVSIYHPCQDNATHPVCVAIDGAVQCMSQLPHQYNSSKDPTELVCKDLKPMEAPMTGSLATTHRIHWEANNYFLEARAVLVYRNGITVTFQDQMDRQICFDSYVSAFGFGSFSRNRFWVERNVPQFLSFDFMRRQNGGWQLL